MKTIENREDVSILVNSFYYKIRKDEMLGPIFNSNIAEEEWPAHLSKLTDFWETNLFGVQKFFGNPAAAHVKVDRSVDYTIEQLHFGKWMQLWFETINELYEGELAERAKDGARRMSTRLFMMIWENRPHNN